MPSEKRKLGDIGEEIACRFLRGKGFSIVEQNYLKKWGEIDVVAKKDGVVHFIEVKTVQSPLNPTPYTRNPAAEGGYRPEENVHPQKLKRIHRAIQTYLMDRKLEGAEWQIDVVTVRLDLDSKRAKVELIENVV